MLTLRFMGGTIGVYIKISVVHRRCVITSFQSQITRMYRQGGRNAWQQAADNTYCLEKKCDFKSETNLMLHVSRVHKLNRTQYLAKHKLPFGTKLYTQKHAEKMQKAAVLRETNKQLKKEVNT